MQEQHLFEYAILRVVPQVEREEFLNAGVVLYCAKQHFLHAKCYLNETRLKTFPCKPDMQELGAYLTAFERICIGGSTAGPIGKLPAAERFRWLTATRSTVLQTSKVHPGFCKDAGEMLTRIFNQFVL
ncbi:MAG: DUF3037 domain-containing protein [Ferruginibacter sp.]|nr:DUF3037 domain-containing protein [Ferruginibacter sp.]